MDPLRIEGAFSGYRMGAVYDLSDGDAWEQISPIFRFHQADRPRVELSGRPPFAQMRVEGLEDWIRVRRLAAR